MRFLLALATAVALTGAPRHGDAALAFADVASSTAADAATPTQLPRGIRPVHYDVSLTPDAKALRFAAHTTVTIDVSAPTASLTLNALGLTFDAVRLERVGSRQVASPRSIAVDAEAETATFAFARPIAAGRYRLSMHYRGEIARTAHGLFAIDYETAAGKERALFTQFEESDARRVIPSWDEPAYKATFSLEAIVPAAQSAVSNMPQAASAAAGRGLRRVRFATSPTMSSYLLFFASGDFERITLQAGATEIGVVTRRGVAAQGRFALESAGAILREYNDYFAVPYPLPKLDNVASPGSSDFFGAMENWGAIFSFEHVLLVDPAISTQVDRQDVFAVAAHEIAHQWFGDLVTMRWWDDIWLNEGFATWMEGRTTARLHPEWDTALRAVARRSRAMRSDAFSTTHAIVQQIATVEQASQAFDEISYGKSAAVIAMLESYVGADAWRDGVRRYLRAHAYGNTVSDDLWREIGAGSDLPVVAIAHDFTRQPGVPLLTVVSATCENGRTTLELAQGEFSLDAPGRAPLAWRIPVVARVAGQAPERVVVGPAGARLVLAGCGAVIGNAGQSGYYRTAMPAAQQAALRGAFASLDPIDQLGVLDDAWALGLAGRAPIDAALDLVAGVADDADASVWLAVADELLRLDGFYRLDPARRVVWRHFAIARLAPVLVRIGWRASADERATTTVLRSRLIEALGELGDEATIAEARRRHAQRESDPDAFPPALRKALLAVVAGHADSASWDAMRAEAAAEKNPLVKDRLYRLLASADDEKLARRALELSLTDEPGATNGAQMLRTVAEQHPELAFDFAIAHADAVERITIASSRFFPRLASESLDPALAERLDTFARARFPVESRRPARAAIAMIGYRATVARERLGAVDAWLRARPR